MLSELQSRFHDAMFAASGDGLVADLRDLIRGEEAMLQRRLAAYRRNAWGNRVYALATSYPVVQRIVGGPFFREAARKYIPDHPSTSGDLGDYGAGFVDFLASYAHAQVLPYLPDVARLEWALQAIRCAANPATADLSVLATTPPERYNELILRPDPRCVRLDSAWPIATIWRVNQEDYVGDMQVDFDRGEHVLLHIQSNVPIIDVLGAGEAAFFDSLQARTPLTAAAETALSIDAAFDFGGCLQRWIAIRLLHSAITKK